MAYFICLTFPIENRLLPPDKLAKQQVLATYKNLDPDGWLIHKDNHSYVGEMARLVYLTKLLRNEELSRHRWHDRSWMTFYGVCSCDMALAMLKVTYSHMAVKLDCWTVDLDRLAEVAAEIEHIDVKDSDVRDLYEADSDKGLLLCRI